MVTYGFYNSVNHDRKYDALQMSRIFDGIIRDGVYMTIGDCFRVTPGEGMYVIVGTGRAWFNHTWTLNDARLPITIPQAEVILNRYDAIVLEVDHRVQVRANSIKVIKGVPATSPVYPSLTKTDQVSQYPLAYIYVGERATSIRQADITNMIGSSETPFVTGVLETINTDMLIAQWQDQWNRFFENQTADMEATNKKWKDQWDRWYNRYTTDAEHQFADWEEAWEKWYADYTQEMIDSGNYWKELWETWFYAYVNDNTKDIADWKHKIESEFKDWFDNLNVMLDGDVAVNLSNEILKMQRELDDLRNFRDTLVTEHAIYYPIEDHDFREYSDLQDSESGNVLDSNSEVIQGRGDSSDIIRDSDGNPIEGRVVFFTNCCDCQCVGGSK